MLGEDRPRDWKALLWPQLGGAIEALEKGIRACPDGVWGDRVDWHEPWYGVSHVLFWLDLHLEGSEDGFHPPEPFDLCELDPAGVLPARVYTREELLAYLEHCRAKALRRLEGLTDDECARPSGIGAVEGTVFDSLLYTMRHVQHHTAQLYRAIREAGGEAPRWTRRASVP